MRRTTLSTKLVVLAAVACILHASTARSDEVCDALAPAAPDEPARSTSGETPCPSDMVEVDGDFCPALEQRCIRRPQEMSYRCLEYERPSGACQAETTHKHYCIDTYEWPNKRGENPVVMQSWLTARDACQAIGKRLCTEDEWTLACEGPEHLPYPYGYERDAEACNIDKSHDLIDEKALASPMKRGAEVARLWKGEPSGARERCVSPYGVHDMTGNVDEWTRNETGKPHRSALKGGYWSWVRGRCRPVTPGHEEDFKYYNIGWRCCADPGTVKETSEALMAKTAVPAPTTNPYVPGAEKSKGTIATATPVARPARSAAPPATAAGTATIEKSAMAAPAATTATATATNSAATVEATKGAFKPVEYAGSATVGAIGVPSGARGHRVFVDGRSYGPDPRVVVVGCGKHVVRIGHDGREQPLDIPCGGRVDASYP